MRKSILLCSLLLACWSFLPQVHADAPSFSSPDEFAQEVVQLCGTGADALTPTDDPTIEDRSDTICEIVNFPFVLSLWPHSDQQVIFPIHKQSIQRYVLKDHLEGHK